MNKMRLDKLLAHSGFGSRKEVKKIIRDGHVYVNDELILDDDFKVDPKNDEILAGDNWLNFKPTVYYLLNKPAGYISSSEAEEYPSVLELIDDYRPDLLISGRLDVDTEGMLVITNDGSFSHQLIHGKKEVPKTYYVLLKENFDKQFVDDIERGIDLGDFTSLPAEIEFLDDDDEILLTIREGKYHQVKRMMKACNNEVEYLRRVKIGNLELPEALEIGEYIELDDDMLAALLDK